MKATNRIKEIAAELSTLNYSCEMNDLMSYGENFGQNDSTHERMDELEEELLGLDPDYYNRQNAEGVHGFDDMPY